MVLWDMFLGLELTKGETNKDTHTQNKYKLRSKCPISPTSTSTPQVTTKPPPQKTSTPHP